MAEEHCEDYMENKKIIQKIQDNKKNNILREKELLAVRIYESQMKNGFANFTDLKETYNYDKFKLSIILDQLNDLCIIKYKLEKGDKGCFYGFVIDKPFIPMIKYWYNKLTNNNQKILEDSSEKLENKGKDKANDKEDLSTIKTDKTNDSKDSSPKF